MATFPDNKGTYYPAGNTWQNGVDARPHGGVTTGFAAVEIAPRDAEPEEVCQRWMRGLGAGCSIDPAQPATLLLAGGQTMRFVKPEPGGPTGVVGVDLWAAPGGYRKFDTLVLCGVKWTLVDPPGPAPEATTQRVGRGAGRQSSLPHRFRREAPGQSVSKK